MAAEIGFNESYGVGFGSGAGVVALIGLLYYVFTKQTTNSPAPQKIPTTMYDMDYQQYGGRKTRKSSSANKKTKRRK